MSDVVTKQVLTEHLSVYFRYFDSDYKDLKKLLNIEPLQLTILPYGTISDFEKQLGKKLRRINPDTLWLNKMLEGANLSDESSEDDE